MTKAERIFNATYEAVKANGKALDYVVCRENERIGKGTIEALRFMCDELSLQNGRAHMVYEKTTWEEYYAEQTIICDIFDTIDNTEEAVDAAKEARKQERENAKRYAAYMAVRAEMEAPVETTTEEAPMIANNSTEFINKAEAAIREVLNGKEGQQIVNTMLAEALKKNPNMPPEEWTQMKRQLMTFIFAMFMKENPQAMRELGTHVYNELRAQ